MRYFLDTEFHEDGKTIDLISIGLVAEDGRELYLVSEEFDYARASQNEWLMENVIRKLPSTKEWLTREAMREQILDFVGPKPEFWAYFADYDWVVLCQLFGKMIDLPDGWPMYCLDLKQEMKRLGIKKEKLPPQPPNAHDALADARWVRDAHACVGLRSSDFKPSAPMHRDALTLEQMVDLENFATETPGHGDIDSLILWALEEIHYLREGGV